MPDELRLRKRIVFLVPAYDEAETIGAVIGEILELGLDADIHVLDNGSTDSTAEVARRALEGCEHGQVHRINERGKGHAVRWAFRNLPARAYVLVDADRTYPLESVATLVNAVVSGRAEMAIGDRLSQGAYLRAHGPTLRWLANRFASWLFNRISGLSLGDLLSGLRVVDGSVARNLPLSAGGFEIEAELALEVWNRGGRIVETCIGYRTRPGERPSKLSVLKHGPGILWTLTAGGLARLARRSAVNEFLATQAAESHDVGARTPPTFMRANVTASGVTQASGTARPKNT